MREKPTFEYDEAYYENLEEWTKASFPVISKLCLQHSPLSAERGLDLGAGKGIYHTVLKNFCRNVAAMDISQDSLQNIRSIGYSGAICADASVLPFKDESFDYIFSTEVLEHIQDYRTLINESFRILISGGKVFFTTTAYSRYGYRFFQASIKDIYLRRMKIAQFLKSAKNYIGGFKNPAIYQAFIMDEIFEPLGGHYHGFFAPKLADDFASAGFSDVHFGCFRAENPLKLLAGGNIRPDVSLFRKIFFSPFAISIKTLNYIIPKLGGYNSNIFISAVKH
ncbi:MAG: class I SAM-dependent methyltransferase [candidate division Zixibacteria bacterium]|nr:class I SAM-dependent methyltransferase [Candidatus Tariuqbacter arcticus]